MKGKEHEEQLRQFFKHQEDPLHLKKYVREHPNNKMAWYLLGREYDAQGKRGKALYCFSQAGEVYEAFENKAIPVSLESLQSLKQWERKGMRKRWLNRIRIAALTTLALAAIAYSPPFEPSSLPLPSVPSLPQDVSAAMVEQTKVYYVTAGKSKENVGAALQEMLIKERLNSYAILAYGKPTDDGKWISWLKPPDLLLSVEGKQDAAQQQIYYHDAESCSCQPTDSAKAQAIYQSWAGQREQELVLRSAIASYTRKNGQPPQELQALNQPYPQNVLPGITPFMQQLYDQQKEQLAVESPDRQGKNPAAITPSSVPETAGIGSGSPGSPNSLSSVSGLMKPLTEPIRIVVDKTNHRLAVISGQMIVRSYPVGLGANKTPEGTFEISEKVRNPNGKSNGDFGSRGMTLSDTLYAIHGTNKPASIEKDQSLGCIRMLQEDVEELFDMAPLGTSVTIGKGLLPSEVKRGEPVFRLPLNSNETNPGKVYKWLD
ncbi:L,D-transpeptidase family protein [Paenibacillus radicis (ex Xue et al. 2023)]|uniref:L,D-transpeptidase family protein n=1 Tax=Paenibacillus radicis (ex Xue et al. 2023) TaxID=2972489 RepID=A0ABT1YGN9_9BACL|nr:L,D-transpeptidase [Paenibacillus radicis (ex Xue et al. 2023)]MCR8631125.1 L,D-transpeptidase family protein [Paenibacillus radicis (ex Xue et al. 2023)]